ncbi:MAG: hypothetical protein JXR51_10745 [Bacteroidales bacterium]|nr:hypothetical protein [Bacteroidales bacterium]MBN2757645.1 hypothetical protein [Bacteroidales bacterium]
MKEYRNNKSFNSNITRSYDYARNISLGMKIKIWLFDVLSVIGLFFFLFSIPFIFSFVSFSSFSAPSFNENDPFAKGEIIEQNPTNAYINEVQVYEYKYSYNTPDGGQYTGVGYSTGISYNINDEVDVKYKRDNSEISTVDGLRVSEFSGWVFFLILIFPVIGISMLFFGTKKAINAIKILQFGEVAFGKFISKVETNVEINNQRVYDLTFEFTAKDNKKYKTHVKTHKYHYLQDDEFEKLVYDRDEPENAVFIDVLPNAVRKYFENEI